MSLVTRCPVCATAFRVQGAQLAARAGKVRCGKCGEIFDGLAGLEEEGASMLRLEPSPQLGLFDPSRGPAPGAASTADGIAEDADAPIPEFLLRPEPSARSWLLWGPLVIVAAATLLAQATYRYRTEIAVLVPAARAGIASACRLLRCEIPLPRHPELMSIDSSDLQADARSDSVIVLNAVLRNRAPFPQEFPALELTLTDERDKPVVRRVLFPRDYLDAARAPGIAQGLPASGEMSLRVSLDAGKARATGYRLYLFYPQ